MRGVIYARYSEGPRQTDQSIEGQVADCRAYADKMRIDVLDVYADRHISGKSVEGRDEFQRMIADAERGLFDAVIVWKIDRFGRSREDIAVNKRRLRRAGVTLFYAKESVPDGPEGILLESLLEGLAEYYSADLQQKVVRGMRESAKKGQYTAGRLPIGYTLDADRHIVIDEEKAAAVREVFARHIADAPMQELRQVLADHGILGRDGRPPVKSVVYRILRNEHYLGRFSFRDVPIEAPAIITEETFREAAMHFKTSRNNAAAKAKISYLFSGRCVCGCCGALISGMTGTGRSGEKYRYYRCEHCRGIKPLQKEAFEDKVVEAIRTEILTDDMIETLTARIMEIQAEDAKVSEAAGLRARLAENSKKQARLVALLEEGGSRAIRARLEELEAEEDALTLQIERAELRHPVIPEAIVRGWLQSFRDGDAQDQTFRRKLVDAFVHEIRVSPGEILVVLNAEKGPHDDTVECSRTALKLEPAGRYANTTRAWLSWPFIYLRIS